MKFYLMETLEQTKDRNIKLTLFDFINKAENDGY